MNKKLFLISMFSFMLAIFGLTFFAFNNNEFAHADSLPQAETHSVNFIAPDNSLLYSTEVPYGMSLNELDNTNLLLNSDFRSNTLGQSSYTAPVSSTHITTVDNWTINWAGSLTNINTNSISLKFTRQYSSFRQVLDDYLSLRGKTVTATIKVSNISSSGVFFRISDNISNPSIQLTSSGVFSFSKTLDNNITELNINLLNTNPTGTNVTLDIEYVKLEIGSTSTPYFSKSTLNSRLSEYSLANYYYTYDFDMFTPITSDLYLSPTKNFYSDSLNFYPKSWNGLSNFNGLYVWTDGANYYYSYLTTQRVLDIETSTWNTKSWNGLSTFSGSHVWTDGANYYFSDDSRQYVLDVGTSTWNTKSWNGLSRFDGRYIWFDGVNYYYSQGSTQRVLDIETSTWNTKSWNGLSNFNGLHVWTDGINYFYSDGSSHYVLDVGTSTWNLKSWNGLSDFDGVYILNFNSHTYYLNGSIQYVLVDYTWVPTSFAFGNFYANQFWSAFNNFYYSYTTTQLVYSFPESSFDIGYAEGYSDGYNKGNTNGYNKGYNKGYSKAVDDVGDYTFFGLISAVIDAPLKAFYGLFNFELMGVNLAGFIQAMLTLAILIFIIRFALVK